MLEGELEVPLTDLETLPLEVGDVISVNIPETIQAGVDGIPVLDCKYGVANGRYALKVERALIPDGAEHGGSGG